MSRTVLLLLFLFGKGPNCDKGLPSLQAEAFSTHSRALSTVTRPVGQYATGSVRTIDSSLHAWRSPFGATSNCNDQKIGNDGLYHITSEEEYRTILEENPDKLIVLKVFSPWCKTCKAMAPKFLALARSLENHRGAAHPRLPIVWVSLSHSKEVNAFVRTDLGVKAVPSVVLHSGNGVKVDSFPCGPSKVETILRPKMVDLISNHVDISTGTLKEAAAASTATTTAASTQTETTTTSTPRKETVEQTRQSHSPKAPKTMWERLVGTHSLDGRHQHPASTNNTVASR